MSPLNLELKIKSVNQGIAKTGGFNKRFIIVLLLILLLSIITFEAFQQLFYIQRFDLVNEGNISIINCWVVL